MVITDLLTMADLIIDGNIGVIQTMVGELVKNPKHEREQFFHPSITHH